MDSWSLSVHADDGVTLIDVDPARAPGSALPIALIAQTLEALSSEGWPMPEHDHVDAPQVALGLGWALWSRFLERFGGVEFVGDRLRSVGHVPQVLPQPAPD